ncbi:centromere-associated protein E isoform X2 [Hyla sarda]|uniref:centromere-associated protein E isoform X2 n=1 Tax=Hyla sarda TaxID=327740 RepID=UPI0024C30017|nr:centromere-associated protein E isoform X2 [Hyla sarda]
MSEGDAVKVCLRVRPLICREQGEQVNLLWKAENNTLSQVDGTRSFNFDRVFHSHETTSQVYQEVAVPIICSALQGYNGTIFAYGQTSSGKTYTMMGSPDNLGIIPQAVQEVFRIIQEIPSREFLLRVSYMEIYNETVTDLLCDDRKKKPLEIREDINRNVYVADLTEELVMVPEHVLQWIKKGEKNRHYGETKMNDHSSRSHTIFRMIVESRERNDPANSENCDGAVMVSHLNLVDLAGSERASQTGAEGVRFKEGCNINRSLFILGQVIKKLSDGQAGGFINYRDSKLTRILQNSLGGNTKTVIICTITPVSFDETLSTLQFASTAKHVRNTPHVNEVLDDQALLKRYRKEIMDLKKQLEELEASSEIKTQAMAKEEHSQLLAEIKQLQKEREDRIWNLTNIVVASSQQSIDDQRVKRKRRVTWAPGKLKDSLCTVGVSPFEIGSKLTANFAKRPKVSEMSSIAEIDDSICTEFSDFDASRVLDDAQDADWTFGNKVTRRERTTTLSHSMIDFSENSSTLTKEFSLQKCKEMEQKVAELEDKLHTLTKEYDMEVGKRESLEKETSELKQQLQSQNKRDVSTLELEITSLKDQIQSLPEDGKQSPLPRNLLDVPEELMPLKSDIEQEQKKLNCLPFSALEEGQDPVQEQLSSHTHDICREQIQMLEQKIADLEGSNGPENNEQNDLMETLQICEALMAEKQGTHEELEIMKNNFDHLVAENESLKREIADLEKCLQEKYETNEFEMLEKQTQKDHEAQLIHEISSLKKLVENAEVYNQELENELENKSNLLKEQEKIIAELKKDSEMLQKKVRYLDLTASMGDGEKLCEEVFQMRQSLCDAETVTRDSQREAAFLRSENLELKEKMDELSIRCEKREKDASDSERQLEIEKSNYKRMQADFQKELQNAYNEINQINGLMAGKVPKDLLSRVELDKKVAEYSKQLANLLEEKTALTQEVASLSEYKSLPSEVEHLKDQVQRTSEELIVLKNEKEQSDSMVMDLKHQLLEKTEQIEKLTEEVTHVQAKCQQAEQQYAELKMLHESLQERCSLTAEDLNKKDSEAECLLKEMDKLKQSLECMEQKLSAVVVEKDELIQAKQELETSVKELEELLRSSRMENESLQGQVNNLSCEVTILQQQTEKQSELHKEKQGLEEKYNALDSEKEHLQEQLQGAALKELQEELKLVVQNRDELLTKVEDLKAEKDNLQQDLNENIELSIETQDELRAMQEELKQHKQLVADLRKQLADCAGDASPQVESQRNDLEEKLSTMTEKLQESKEKYETLNNEKMELERVHQSLLSEMTCLQECMHSAECALSKVEEENNELKQKLEEQLKSREPEEQMKNTNLQESENLESDLSSQVKQEDYVKSLNLQEQMLAILQEKDALHESLNNITAERDQLKLDLQENIEMSIETQEELRSALNELKVKTKELESLNTQINENKEKLNGLGDHLKQDCEKYLAQLEVEKSDRTKLQCEVEGKNRKIEELETQLEDILRNFQETESKYEIMVQTLELVTKERDHLTSPLSVNNSNKQFMDKQTKEQEIQVSEMLVNLDGLNDIPKSLEETETERNQLRETLVQLQQQLHLVFQEKGELQQIIDNLKTERCELMTNLQRHTENEALRATEECGLKNEIEKLKEQQSTVQKQLNDPDSVEDVNTSKEINGLDGYAEQRHEFGDMEINLGEENVTKNPTLLEEMQGELLSKLRLLQEELQKEVIHREELQCKLDSVLTENACLKENLDSVLACSSKTQEELQRCQEELNQQIHLVNNVRMEASSSTSRDEKETITDLLPSLEEEVLGLQEKLLQKNTEYQQLIQNKERLEQDKNTLSSQVEGLTKDMKETQLILESLEKEKLEARRQLLDLQRELEIIVQERDHLKDSQQRFISSTDQENQTENNEQTSHFGNDLEQRATQCHHEDFVQSNFSLNNDLEVLKMNLKNSEAELEMLRSEKYDNEQKINHLKQQVELITGESENLKMAQQCLVSERDKLKEELEKNVEKLCCLQEEVLGNANVHEELIQRKEELEQGQIGLKSEIESLLETLKEAQSTLESLQNEKLETEQQLSTLQQQMNGLTQERDELNAMKQKLTLEMSSLKENMNTEEDQLRTPVNEEAMQSICNNVLDNHLNNMESELASLRKEKSDIEEKLFSLQQHLESMVDERDELKVRLQSLVSERDHLKEDLKDNVDMAVETQDDLRKAQGDLQQQKERVEELICNIVSLEQKSSTVEKELQKTVSLLKEANSEREVFEQTKQKLVLELEHLHNSIKNKEFALGESEKERSKACQKIADLTEQLKTVSEERDQVHLTKEELQKQFRETQDVLKQIEEDLHQQEQNVEKLTTDMALLEDKYSSLERELQEKVHTLNKAVQEKQNFDQSNEDLTSEMEQIMEELKSKDSDLKQAEKEKEAASQKILELTSIMKSITQERDDLKHSNENLEEEAKKLREEIQQLKHEHTVLSNEQARKTCQLDELETELQQLQEKMHLSDASTHQLVVDNVALLKQTQQYDLEMASLRQEQEQFQQLLQRARSEKENICASLQDQEKAVARLQEELVTSQAKLQAVQRECDESNAHLIEKVNEVNDMLKEISSLQDQMQQLRQEVKEEKMKNHDLCEKVDLLEKEIRVLHLIQSEPTQEEDELAERTEILEQKNQEWKELMVNISTVYSDHQNLLNNLSSDLQSETEAQKQSMSAIKESLSSTHSRAFGNLQTEHIKLNSQMQTLLNKFKVVYRNAAVKDEYYTSVKDTESELCAVQKKNDELLLQCQSLEQHGTKWSEGAAEELKFCELEFMNQLLIRKMEVMKHVEAGFSEVKVALNSMETDLNEEIKCKREFSVWLEEFKGLHFDSKNLHDGVLQENRRIAGVIQHLTKRLKIFAQSKTKQDTMMYLNSLNTELQEKKEKNKELLQRMQQSAPSGDSNILEEENSALRKTLKNVQLELKKMQSRIQDLENELSSAKADSKRKEQKALLLEDELRSSTAESQLSEMQLKVTEKEKHLQTVLKEIKVLQEKIAKGAAPYTDEIDSLKNQVVRVEMERMKLSKATDHQIASLKACIEDRETCLRKLKEQLRRNQKETDTTICSENSSSSSQYPLTCGGGSGIVQSTAMLMLQSENAALKREIAQYKKKCHQLSRNISSREDELKKLKDRSSETPSTPLSLSHHDEVMSYSKSDLYKMTPASPKKSEIPIHHVASPGKTGVHKKRVLSPAKIEMHKTQPMSPSKMERHSVPTMSPGNAGLYRKRPASPLKTDGSLFSALTTSPCKKQTLPEKVDLPKDKFFDVRAKSLPYCPSKFFDNSCLGTLPDPSTPPSANNPCVESETDLYAGTTTETSDINNWWDRAGKTENPNDCKTS